MTNKTMANTSVNSLLQVHYHFRTGGVKEVIKGYSEAFSVISGTHSFNALLCRSDIDQNESNLKIINISECDYLKISDTADFYKYRESLIKKIEAVLTMMPLPAVILCHNMTLAKNPSLSSALRFLAQKKDPLKYRFFWIVHDFAEEGRVEMLGKIEYLQKHGIAIKDELYASRAPVHFIVPGKNAFSILKKAGIDVTYVPNPVRKDDIVVSLPERKDILDRLTELSLFDGCRFDPDRTVYCYPSRMIKRKNILEAIMLASICLNSSLIIGAAGTSTFDVNLNSKVLDLAKEPGMHIVLDYSRLPWKSIIGSGYCGNPVPYLYTICDKALSTSLAEGFGYALYEPWLYKKAVFARRPAGFNYPEELDSNLLYEHLPIPLEWVNWEDLRKKYQNFYKRVNGLDVADEIIKDNLIVNGTVDFGVLEEDTQIGIIKKIINDEYIRCDFIEVLKTSIAGWPGLEKVDSECGNIVQKNYSILQREFSKNSFIESFKNCISIIPTINSSDIEYNKINLALNECGFKLFFSISGSYNENIRK